MSQLTAFEVDDSPVLRRGKAGRPPMRGTKLTNVAFDQADRAILEELAVELNLSFREVLRRAIRTLKATAEVRPDTLGGSATRG